MDWNCWAIYPQRSMRRSLIGFEQHGAERTIRRGPLRVLSNTRAVT